MVFCYIWDLSAPRIYVFSFGEISSGKLVLSREPIQSS